MIEFTKMHGAGNDYIYIDASQNKIANPSECSIRWSNRHKGIGSDGLVLIEPSAQADFKMRIFNADGSEAQMCGNASRCIGKYVYEHHLTGKTDISLETLSGIKALHLHLCGGQVDSVTVNMGIPRFNDAQLFRYGSLHPEMQELQVDDRCFYGCFVSMGNPHFVVFVEDISEFPVSFYGPLMEHHFLFPQKTNVEFAQLMDGGIIRMRVWERGSDITMACGTGACATAVAAIALKERDTLQTVQMDGGEVKVRWEGPGKEVQLTGGAVEVFQGQIEEEDENYK